MEHDELIALVEAIDRNTKTQKDIADGLEKIREAIAVLTVELREK